MKENAGLENIFRHIHRNPEDHIVKPPKVEKREMKVYDVPQTVNLIDLVRGKAEGYTNKKLAAAVQRLLDAKRIKIETSGSPSRQRSRLVAVELAAA